MTKTFPLAAQFAGLIVLLAISAFFSLSETAMMAANRYKLQHRAREGHLGAKRTLALLAQPDRLLGVILIGNNLVNTGAATLASLITLQCFGDSKWALGAATLLITFAILVFSEITPKIVGASHADRLSQALSLVFTPLIRVLYPAIWFVNLFTKALLKLLRLSPRPGNTQQQKLTLDELRTLVMESREIIPATHRTLLTNLFDLGKTSVEDVMTHRSDIEALDLDAPWEEVKARLKNSPHTRLPVIRESFEQLLGMLPVHRVLATLHEEDFTEQNLLAHLQAPYFVPLGTPLFAQLRFFQENRQRFAFVVDEYGEVEGLVTLEDIVEEIVGEFTEMAPGAGRELAWDTDASVLVEGRQPLRTLNRKLGLDFPLEHARTLNGLILEHFEDIPEAGTTFRIADVAVEVVQTQGRSVKTARLTRIVVPNTEATTDADSTAQ
ncbi:MAG: HlyC/CorC family transporter [Zoogloeaceae bacterium]|jgi:Mg2+/Co2+ transporter CorB|nr:HlyC/CorC family transporter [Zoogloeaceae bacterium]